MSPPELAFELLGVVPERFAVTPTLGLRVGLERLDGGPVQSILLTTTVTIAAAQRAYDAETRERLAALFGPPDEWRTTLRGLTWARITATVPAFTGRTDVTLPVACGHELQVAAEQYLHALAGGDVPIELVFNGTVFHPGDGGALRTAQIPWRHEVSGRFPTRTWRELMDRYYGNTRWLRLADDRFDRLAAYRARHACASFDAALEALLSAAEEGERA